MSNIILMGSQRSVTKNNRKFHQENAVRKQANPKEIHNSTPTYNHKNINFELK